MNRKQKIRARFDAELDHWDGIYDYKDFSGYIMQRRREHLLANLDGSNLGENSKVLDLGCGPGLIAEEIVKRGYTVFGMDYSFQMVKKARVRCNTEESAARFAQGDTEFLSFRNGSFDAVICLGVFPYLTSVDAGLYEISRVLKPGGIAILNIINKFDLSKCLNPFSYINQVFKLGKMIKQKVSRSNEGITLDIPESGKFHHRGDSIQAFERALRKVGLQKIDSVSFGYQTPSFLEKGLFQEQTNIRVSMFFERLTWLPVFKNLGWEYLIKVKKLV